MTVKELIEELQKMPEDEIVLIQFKEWDTTLNYFSNQYKWASHVGKLSDGKVYLT